MAYERPCSACDVLTRVEVLERIEQPFPLREVCPGCVPVLALEAHFESDDADDHAGEPECECRSFCPRCAG